MHCFSIDFLIVLPELVQLLLINALLGFALLFSQFEQKQTLTLKLAQFNLINCRPLTSSKGQQHNAGFLQHKHSAYLMVPTLQTEPFVRLMILGLLGSAFAYGNMALNQGIGFETLIWDPLSRFMTILLCFSAAAAIGLGSESLKRLSRYEFLCVLWLSLLGMFCLIKSINFLAFYLAVELQSLSFYMLAAMRSRTEASAEAGLKYFILSAFSSALLLLGMTLIYGALGSQNFADLAIAMNHFSAMPKAGYATNSVTVGLGCICVSLLFKLGAAPFHTWLADVYEGSMTAITAWFALTAKIAVVTVLIRLVSFSNVTPLHGLLTGVAVISLLVGSLSAMRQVKLKRLLAFSGIANVGWFLLALVSGQWQLLVIHLMVYNLLNITLWGVFITPLFRKDPDLAYRQRFTKALVCDQAGDSLTIKYISDLHQIYKANPSVAFAITIALFSLAGIPPLAGFYSKYLIINALTQSELYIGLGFALGGAVLSAFYYIRVIKTIYFSVAASKTQWWFSLHTMANAPLIAWTTMVTLLWLIKPDYACVWLAMIN